MEATFNDVEYISILKESLQPGITLPFSCYTYLKNSELVIPLIQKDEPISEKVFERISKNKDEVLYIKKDEKKAYENYFMVKIDTEQVTPAEEILEKVVPKKEKRPKSKEDIIGLIKEAREKLEKLETEANERGIPLSLFAFSAPSTSPTTQDIAIYRETHDKELNTLRKEFKELKDKYDEIIEEKEILEAQRDVLLKNFKEHELRPLQEKYDEVVEENQVLHKQQDILALENSNKIKQIDQLTEELEKLKHQNEENSEKNKANYLKISEYKETAFRESYKRISELEKKLNEKVEIIKKKEEELNTKLTEVQDKGNSSSSEAKKVEAIEDEYKKIIQFNSDVYKKVEIENRLLSDTIAKYDGIISEDKRRLQDLEIINRRVLGDQKNDSNIIQTLNEHILDLKSILEQKDLSIVKLTQSLDKFSKGKTQEGETCLKSLVASQSKEISSLHEEIEEKKKRLDTLQKDLESFHSLNELKIKELESKLSISEDKKLILEKKCEGLESKYLAINIVYEQNKRSIEKLVNQIEELKKDRTKLAERIKTLESTKNVLSQIVSKTQMSGVNHEQLVKRLERDYARIVIKYKEIQAKYIEENKKVFELQKKVRGPLYGELP